MKLRLYVFIVCIVSKIVWQILMDINGSNMEVVSGMFDSLPWPLIHGFPQHFCQMVSWLACTSALKHISKYVKQQSSQTSSHHPMWTPLLLDPIGPYWPNLLYCSDCLIGFESKVTHAHHYLTPRLSSAHGCSKVLAVVVRARLLVQEGSNWKTMSNILKSFLCNASNKNICSLVRSQRLRSHLRCCEAYLVSVKSFTKPALAR